MQPRRRQQDATIGVETQACELGQSVGMPVERQLRSVIEAIAVVIGSPSQRLYGLVEVLEDLPPVLERTSFVLTSPSLSFPLSFPSPSLVLTLISPSLCDEPAGDSSGQGARTPMPATTSGTQRGVVFTLPMMVGWRVNALEAGQIQFHTLIAERMLRNDFQNTLRGRSGPASHAARAVPDPRVLEQAAEGRLWPDHAATSANEETEAKSDVIGGLRSGCRRPGRTRDSGPAAGGVHRQQLCRARDSGYGPPRGSADARPGAAQPSRLLPPRSLGAC